MTGFARSVFRVVSVFLVLLTGSLAWSQGGAGTVVGQVTDQTNAVLADATVTLTDVATGKSQETKSNETGRYIFTIVPIGTYDISVEKSGFAKAKVEAQTVSVGVTTTVNVAMKLGAATETVTVEAAGAQLQTMSATVGTTIGFQNLQELPNLGRDASSLIELQPGVSLTGATAGAVRDQNTFQLDGGNNTNDMDGTMNTYTPSYASGIAGGGGGPTGVMPTPVESIEEFKVNVTNQTADFNGSAGAQVQMVTRRGGQSWHGSAYEFYLGSDLGANSWSNNHTPQKDLSGNILKPYTPLPSNHYNRFGAAAGGPLTSKSILGGKTYVFFNFEGRRFPQNATFEKNVPTATLRAGVIQLQDSKGNWHPYNLNPNPVTVNGVTYAPATCGGAACDPRGIGINSFVSQLWSKNEPIGNDTNFSSSDGGHNTVGFLTGLKLPQNDNNGVARMDHDFGQKWKFMGSFRYYELSRATSDQVDVGGLLGGSLGSAVPTSNRPQYPWLYVAQMTTSVTPTLTNNFNYSFLRNWWQWGTKGGVGQFSNLGGALEVGGESTNALIPYNINTQSTRNRFWNGHDQTFRDDATFIKSSHLMQFGGSVQHNYDGHGRNDNGGGIDAFNVYQIGGATGGLATPTAPDKDSLGAACTGSCVLSGTSYKNVYAEVLGIVTQAQSLYSRKTPDMSLLPLGTPVVAHVITDYYSGYFNDSWRMKPSITLNYGLSYLLQMPPFERDGKQVMLVDSADQPVYVQTYLGEKKAAALAGQNFNPVLGFATVQNVAGGRKYPYDTYYGGFSPHVALAWNPKFDSGILGKLTGGNQTVLRAGYSRIYGRLNGVANILTPLLTPSLLQAVQCVGVSASGSCLGTGGVTSTTAFRIGTDGTTAPLPAATPTLPQPFVPGVGALQKSPVGDALGLDPSFRPNTVDSIDVSIQRQLGSRAFVELGYIGRLVNHELIDLDINAVPYMTTLGGETYADAFGKLYSSLCGLSGPTCATTSTPTAAGYSGPVLPFFEAAMGGPTSAFCTGKPSCTAAIASNSTLFSALTQVRAYDFWASMQGSSSWTLGRTLPALNPPGGCVAASTSCAQTQAIGQSLSIGNSNYHAGFVTFNLKDYHGITGVSNFTWSKAMGMGATTQSTSLYTVPDPWNLRSFYGPQSWDTKFIFNQGLTYHTPFYKGQQGFIGKALGGWGFSPLFVAQSGFPEEVDTNGDCQSFGESNCDDSTFENMVLIGKVPAMKSHFGVVASGAGNSANVNSACLVAVPGYHDPAINCGGIGMSAFADPTSVYASFRRPVLGIDSLMGGTGRIRGFNRWNLDLQITKNTKFSERFSTMFYGSFVNVLNHFQPSDPAMSVDNSGTFARISGAAFNQRQLELGLRFAW